MLNARSCDSRTAFSFTSFQSLLTFNSPQVVGL